MTKTQQKSKSVLQINRVSGVKVQCRVSPLSVVKCASRWTVWAVEHDEAVQSAMDHTISECKETAIIFHIVPRDSTPTTKDAEHCLTQNKAFSSSAATKRAPPPTLTGYHLRDSAEDKKGAAQGSQEGEYDNGNTTLGMVICWAVVI